MKNHVAIIIENNGKILFVKRSGNKKILPGAWSFPSGTLEKGERIEDAAKREAIEELGISIETNRIIARKELPEFSSCLNFILCHIKEGIPRIKAREEIERFEWMSFDEFFSRFQDSEIGHGLVWLRKNPHLWEG